MKEQKKNRRRSRKEKEKTNVNKTQMKMEDYESRHRKEHKRPTFYLRMRYNRINFN